MDFFARQQHARAQTGRLLVLFVLAVIFVELAVTFVVVVVFAFATRSYSLITQPAAWLLSHTQMIATCAAGVFLIIIIGMAMRSLKLSDGASLARSMGSDLVDANSV